MEQFSSYVSDNLEIIPIAQNCHLHNYELQHEVRWSLKLLPHILKYSNQAKGEISIDYDCV